MLKVINSIGELQLEQLLSVYAGSYRSFRAETAFVSYLRDDFFRQKDACYCLWVADNAYKAALRLEPYRDGLLLQALETALPDRKKGYGHELVTAALEHFSGMKYKRIYSHVDKRNIPSLKLHKKCGFQITADSAVLLDGTVTTNCCTLCYNY